MAFSIFGGVHPKENKHYAEHCPVQEFPAPDLLVIPMSQHSGASCIPSVKKGDRVTVGQKLGNNEGLCAPVHASVSGIVKAVENRPHPVGTSVLSVVVENDHQYTLCPDVTPRTPEQVAALSVEEMVEIVREAGIVGLGGAVFPTYSKLESSRGKTKLLIVNASECEPYIVADDRLCQEYPREVLSGIQLVMKMLDNNDALIAIEDNKPAAAETLRNEIDPKSGIRVEVLPTRYPQGANKQLIQAVTGQQVPPGARSTSTGCTVINIGTCKAIHDAIYEGMPLIRRLVTVTGDIVMEPKNLLVPIGTPFQALLDAVGQKENPYKVISGGPMMGTALYDLASPVIKGTNAVTILGKKNRFCVDDPQCIRCGKCMDACPMKLMPIMMYQAYQGGSPEEMAANNIKDCMECGCCAYACPAGIPLVQAFRAAKQKMRSAQRR